MACSKQKQANIVLCRRLREVSPGVSWWLMQLDHLGKYRHTSLGQQGYMQVADEPGVPNDASKYMTRTVRICMTR